MSDSVESGGQASADVIEISPEMIRAGVVELREKCFGESLSEIVRDVYLAMALARTYPLGPCSQIRSV